MNLTSNGETHCWINLQWDTSTGTNSSLVLILSSQGQREPYITTKKIVIATWLCSSTRVNQLHDCSFVNMQILFRIQNLWVLQSLVRFFIVTLLGRNNKIQISTNRVRVKDSEIKNVNIFIVLTSSSRVKIESGVKQIGTLLFLMGKICDQIESE